MVALTFSFQKNLIVWKRLSPHSPTPSSPWFQKNLIVWKLAVKIVRYGNGDRFQKNLIVWKRTDFAGRQADGVGVSEELNSVETFHPVSVSSFLTPRFRRT